MRQQFLRLLTCMALLFAPVFALANSDEENGDLLSQALVAVTNKDWISAEHNAAQISDPAGLALIVWSRLRAGEGEWLEYQGFLEKYADWPGLKRLRKRGEAVIPQNADPRQVIAYFETQLPQTGTGALRLAEAYRTQGRTSEARDEITRAWLDLALSENEQSEILAQYEGIVSRKHYQRLDNLLWSGMTIQATRMLSLVDDGTQKLARARIALRRGSKDVDALIEAVPAARRDDAGLAYDRFRWRVKKDRWDEAEAILRERSVTIAKLGRPKVWAPRRRDFVRRAMRAGNPELAYELASSHGIHLGSDYADLEWLAGYLSLRYLNAPKRALVHFENLQSVVSSPISLGRAGYWRGRTHEYLGNLDSAQIAYEQGAQHQTSFYGQLAAEKLGFAPDHALTGQERVPDWRDAEFVKSDVLGAALLLHYADEQGFVRWFFTHMAETLEEQELVQLSDLALEMERPFVALGVAKEAAKRGIVLNRSYFPVTDLASYSVDVDGEVAMAIARRESELNPYAVSPAGARGLMQVMPSTARKVAGDLGMDYSKNRLTNDWRYNATLGTAYLGALLEMFNGSYVLAFAAYNAGPSRANRWIELYGDPRDSEVDPIDWIEHIPFNETRNYVMRVTESLHVYRARLKGQAEVVSLTADLTKG